MYMYLSIEQHSSETVVTCIVCTESRSKVMYGDFLLTYTVRQKQPATQPQLYGNMPILLTIHVRLHV